MHSNFGGILLYNLSRRANQKGVIGEISPLYLRRSSLKIMIWNIGGIGLPGRE
jgi:hypothetical protein